MREREQRHRHTQKRESACTIRRWRRFSPENSDWSAARICSLSAASYFAECCSAVAAVVVLAERDSLVTSLGPILWERQKEEGREGERGEGGVLRGARGGQDMEEEEEREREMTDGGSGRGG